MTTRTAPRRAFLLGTDARAVTVDVDSLDHATWRLTVVSPGLTPVVAYLVAGAHGSLLVDPGSTVTWPSMLGALNDIDADLDIRWVFSHSAHPASIGALPLLEPTLGGQPTVVTTASLLPSLSHYGTRLPLHVLAPGEALDLGDRRLVVEYSGDGLTCCFLRDTHTGMLFGAGAHGGTTYHLPGRLETVRAQLENVLLTTLAPIALEGRALAAMAPVGRVTSVRAYVNERDLWYELGGRPGIRGRELSGLPPRGDLTVRIELTDPSPIVIDLRFAPESAGVVTDPDTLALIEALRRPLATAMRRLLSMRESVLTTSQLRADTRRDPLTGAGNRRALADWHPGGSYAVLMIDLDRFKLVNDQLGHRAGDTVLRLVAEVVAGQIRGGDLLIRYGGDEFLVLLSGADQAVAEQVAERIRSSVARLDGEGLTPTGTVTVSIGVAAGTGAVEGLIAGADMALYDAKTAGRDTVRIAD